MKKKIILIVIVILVIFGIAYFAFSDRSESPNFITTVVQKTTISKEVTATGEVTASQLVTVGAQASGQIKKLYVTLGQTVKKGDMIAQIDSTTQQNAYDIESSKLKSYKAALDAAQIELRVAKAQYERNVALLKSKATSKSALDSAESSYASARANVSSIEAQIKQSEIALNTDKVNLSYTKIVSPMDGTIVSIPIEEGQTVNANLSTPTIVQIADLNQMKILMEISEGDINSIKPGMDVTYSVLSAPDEQYKTTVKSIDPGLTTLSNGSYSQGSSSDAAIYYYGRLEVNNTERKLRIGMTTENTIIIASQTDVLAVPISSVNANKEKSYVYMKEQRGGFKQVSVVTGISDGVNIEILEGLKDGDEIVISDINKDSDKVETNFKRTPRM